MTNEELADSLLHVAAFVPEYKAAVLMRLAAGRLKKLTPEELPMAETAEEQSVTATVERPKPPKQEAFL